MLILVTNDDGLLAPGLRALHDAASRFGEVYVVAPEGERSGSSHAITLCEPLRVREFGPRWWGLSGTPTDCVFIAINHLLQRRPDLVLSGINRGPNLGGDVLYSGTVGGAMEATVQHIPAIAFSLVSATDDYPFSHAQPHVAHVLERVMRHGIPDGVMLNVNIPAPSLAPFRGYRVTRLGRRIYSNDVIVRTDPRGASYLWIGGTRVTMDMSPQTDSGAVHEGFVSITPLRPDLMAHEVLGKFTAFEEEDTCL